MIYNLAQGCVDWLHDNNISPEEKLRLKKEHDEAEIEVRDTANYNLTNLFRKRDPLEHRLQKKHSMLGRQSFTLN
jgi:hypothetical protein